MFELLPMSFTFISLVKAFLVIAINMFLGSLWYSSIGFQRSWREAMQWKDNDEHDKTAIIMSNIGTLLNSFLLNILLIAFDIRKHQFLNAMMTSIILCGFYAFNAWNYVFFTKKSDYKRHRTLYLIDIGFTFVLYTLVSFVLIGF